MSETNEPVMLQGCPLCGPQQSVYLNAPNEHHRYGSINCPACMIVLPGAVSDQAELIRMWNTRPATSDYERGRREAFAEAAKVARHWLAYFVADKILALAGSGPLCTEDDGSRDPIYPALSDSAPPQEATEIDRLKADNERLRSSQHETMMRLFDWAYLHATEGELWPDRVTAERAINLATERAPTQRDADTLKATSRFPTLSPQTEQTK